MKYDIFISYRREGGYDTAKHLNDLLVRDGYKVSFDIDTLRNGDFDTQLLERIEQCKDFILIVDEHCFDRTLDKDFEPQKDWLRCELAHALKHNKNIVPVFLSNVKGFPDRLPKDIAAVVKKNGPEYNRYYFNDFYTVLKKRFLHKKRKPLLYTFLISIFLMLVTSFFLIFNNDRETTDRAALAFNVDNVPEHEVRTNTNYYSNDINTRHLFIKGLRNGIEYYPKNDPSNKGCTYIFKDGRVISIKQIFYQTGMWFTATDESGEYTSLPINFGEIGYEDISHEVEYGDNEYLIGQCDINGDNRDELVIAVRTQEDRWLNNDYGVGMSINFFELEGGKWELLTTLNTDSNIHPMLAKIVNNNVYIYWLRYDEKYTLINNEFVSTDFEGRVFTKNDFSENPAE